MGSSTCWRKRTPNDVKEEYCNIFLNGIMGRHTWRETERSKTKDHTQTNPLLPPSPQNVVAITYPESIMLGYFTQRDDYEVEYDNECESLVSQLEDDYPSSSGAILTEDDELAKALNIAHVDLYRSKLRERERRKRVSREHHLISDYFKENPIGGSDRKSSSAGAGQNGPTAKRKNQKDPVLEKLKILSEFQSVKEHQNFISGIMREKDVKARIKDLMRMRKNGIKKLSDSLEFEVQRVRRNNRKKNEKRRQQQNAILGEAAAELNLTLAPSPISIKSEDFGTCGSAAQSPLTSSFGLATSPHRVDEKTQISSLPGYEILSTNEKKLCANLRLTPAHYISYKTCLLTNHLQKKKGQTPKPLNPSGLDKNNRKIIFNFLMRAGWITAY